MQAGFGFFPIGTKTLHHSSGSAKPAGGSLVRSGISGYPSPECLVACLDQQGDN